jgi:hypothetical protein
LKPAIRKRVQLSADGGEVLSNTQARSPVSGAVTSEVRNPPPLFFRGDRNNTGPTPPAQVIPVSIGAKNSIAVSLTNGKESP